jgi:transposase
MMAQDDRVVVGIDVAKDKVDACIRSLSQEQTFLSTAAGQRALIRWLRKHKVGKVAMEASGGYERDWAKTLREAGIEVRIPSGCAASPDRPGVWPRTMRLTRR